MVSKMQCPKGHQMAVWMSELSRRQLATLQRLTAKRTGYPITLKAVIEKLINDALTKAVHDDR